MAHRCSIQFGGRTGGVLGVAAGERFLITVVGANSVAISTIIAS